MGRLFGTDGVRGLANAELDCGLALKIGRAAAEILMKGKSGRPRVLIGSDTRRSSDMLINAVSAGLMSAGADVAVLGVIPTPAVAYLTVKYGADAGIVISASHNPAEFNGIKIFSSDGFKLPDALEEEIEDVVLGKSKGIPTKTGSFVGTMLSGYNAKRDYCDFLLSCLSEKNALSGLRIAVDCACGAACRTAETVFAQTGAEVFYLSDSSDGMNINEGCGSTHPERLCAFVRENRLDAGLAFDGDADRCLACDGNGTVIDGDMIMALCALDLKEHGLLRHNTVVGTVMTNYGFVKFCGEQGIRFEPSKVGDRYVLEKMCDEGYSFGGEQSGHIIFGDIATTGDGQLTGLMLMQLLKRSGKPLSELCGVMQRFPQAERSVRVSAEKKLLFYTDERIKSAVEEIKRELGDDGRAVVRPSGTEPVIRIMTEAPDAWLTEKTADDLTRIITECLCAE